jgi:predicted AAA+ superfamily ATPase
MTSETLSRELTIQNSWWNEGGLWQDPDLERVRRSPLQYRPEPIAPAECAGDAVLTLRGPRRTGKTVTLKLLVAALIEREGWRAREILWLTAETLRTMAQLEEALAMAAERFRPRLLCIDEVTAVTGWQRVVKKLRDTGLLAGRCVVLTGSSAHDLKAGSERMAGRRGAHAHPDRVLLPMGFADFERQVLRVAPRATAAERQHLYLACGGFPFRVEALLRAIGEGRPFDATSGMQVFDDVLFYEIGRRRLDRNIAIEVVARLAAIGTGAVSYEGFAKPLTVVKDTGRKYLDALGDAFLVATISSYDTSRSRVAPKKDRKLLWVDPGLGDLPRWLHQAEALREPERAETSVGVELLRRYEARLFEGLSAPRNVFTWRSASGNEVDFLVIDRSRRLLLPVEVKYQEAISDWDFQVVERAFGKGTLVTKHTARERPKARALPLADFLRASG